MLAGLDDVYLAQVLRAVPVARVTQNATMHGAAEQHDNPAADVVPNGEGRSGEWSGD
jgi:hypothetical protein